MSKIIKPWWPRPKSAGLGCNCKTSASGDPPPPSLFLLEGIQETSCRELISLVINSKLLYSGSAVPLIEQAR